MRLILELLDRCGLWEKFVGFSSKWLYTFKYVVKWVFWFMAIIIWLMSRGSEKKKSDADCYNDKLMSAYREGTKVG